jgi:hypothetical protein
MSAGAIKAALEAGKQAVLDHWGPPVVGHMRHMDRVVARQNIAAANVSAAAIAAFLRERIEQLDEEDRTYFADLMREELAAVERAVKEEA